MPQKHDRRWIKRQAVNKPAAVISTEGLARELVRRGLASPQILSPRKENNQ